MCGISDSIQLHYLEARDLGSASCHVTAARPILTHSSMPSSLIPCCSHSHMYICCPIVHQPPAFPFYPEIPLHWTLYSVLTGAVPASSSDSDGAICSQELPPTLIISCDTIANTSVAMTSNSDKATSEQQEQQHNRGACWVDQI